MQVSTRCVCNDHCWSGCLNEYNPQLALHSAVSSLAAPTGRGPVKRGEWGINRQWCMILLAEITKNNCGLRAHVVSVVVDQYRSCCESLLVHRSGSLLRTLSISLCEIRVNPDICSIFLDGKKLLFSIFTLYFCSF